MKIPYVCAAISIVLASGQTSSFDRSRDRGTGIPTSLFGTYIEDGELLVYPFYEYTKTSAFEYKPSELGVPGEADFLGETVEQEYLLFLSYGFAERFSVELETAVYAKTTFDKAPNDPSLVPARIEESGFGDVDMQLRWRWSRETVSYTHLTLPTIYSV